MEQHTPISSSATMNPSQQTPQTESDLAATAPGQVRVIKRNGKVVSFDLSKIEVAVTKAFLAVEGGQAAGSSRVHETVRELAQQIWNTLLRRHPGGGTVHIEDIQDQVELALMRSGEQKVARAYVLYREKRAEERAAKEQAARAAAGVTSNLRVKDKTGQLKPLNMARLQTLVQEACEGLKDVDANAILKDAVRNLYDGVAEADVSQALIMSARPLIERDPAYAYVTARLLLDVVRAEALSYLKIAEFAQQHDMNTLYPKAFEAFLARGIELELVSPELATFDLAKLGAAIKPERDMQFDYLGIQTLYDRYFIHHNNVRIELPQVFFMRVAMGLSIREPQKNERAIEFYNLLSSNDYMSSTPTLFNAGTLHSQLSSCYLTTVPDDLGGIFAAVRDNALLSKFAGGLGNDWTPVRGLGAHIKGTNGKSQGVVPFMKVANDTAVAVNQGGKRKGAVCAYLETWHIDIEEFLELRKNTGDDRRRTHDMNTANWVPDLFMKRVTDDQDWTLFSPNDVPDLHDLYGKAFQERYEHYERLAKEGKIKVFKTLPAKDIWRKMLSMLFETGHPWITFKDVCNLRSPQQHVGVVHSSNLCTEITLNTNQDEIAVCNLGSINLVNHIFNGALNLVKLEQTVKTAVRMLDNVIDINFYPVPQAQNSNMKHRPIGLGIMGFQDALYMLKTPYGTDAAVEFADRSMEAISYYAISASSELAKERGSYQTFEGSLWSKGILPIDSVKFIAENRGNDYVSVDLSQTMDWGALRSKVQKQGMRNSNVMAIAPTATIANITGVSQSIEPTYQNLYVKSNLSGEFTIINFYLVEELKKRDLWDNVMVNDLKYYDGSVQKIDRIPADLKALFATAFEVDCKWLIEAGSRRQKWLDQAQSLNLYINQPNGKKLDLIYRMAWYRGLKTTYYLRSLGATSTEKSTVSDGALNAVSSKVAAPAPLMAADEPAPKLCSIDNPECEACQ
ncbi:ribonucleoside-diphosphate reductase subunit alpha [Permianibacter fluminis]|uniref:ribonucleoside-diphosphate reductase subunit alpha n=1 Tax=Permianibacter fluminis TaxID=2738515 RepID=UPI002E285F64|nr:ribonucleoside-diphosphate reductase subunit alpha [Permianibacter fluminis]